MIDPISLLVSNLDTSKRFYEAALAPLGYAVLMQFPGIAGIGVAPKPDFWLGERSPADGGRHVAFHAHPRRGRRLPRRGARGGREGQRRAGAATALPRQMRAWCGRRRRASCAIGWRRPRAEGAMREAKGEVRTGVEPRTVVSS